MIIQPLDKRIPKRFEIATSAAGAGLDVTQTVPANRIWELLSVRVTLTTDVTATNRRMVLTITNDGGVRYIDLVSAYAQGASVSYTYQYLPNVGQSPPVAAYTYMTEPMPSNILLLPSWVVRTNVVNLQGGDNITGFRYIYNEWIDPDFS